MNLKQTIADIPEVSGIYIFKGIKHKILYVGKALNLKKRIRSYFRKPEQLHPRVKKLVAEIKDIDMMLTPTEVEALLLERSLIRQHKPPYNIIFRDDKEYPLIRVDFEQKWPRIEKVRRRKKHDQAIYLGPFSQVSMLNQVLDTIFQTFPIIRCSEYQFRTATRPCNYYHMNRCLAPCALPVSTDDYRQMIHNALDIIRGKNSEVRNRLEKKMHEASERLNFELAASLRDQIRALTRLQSHQSVVVHEIEYADIIGFFSDQGHITFQILCLREHYIRGYENQHIKIPFQTSSEILEQFLLQYYNNRENQPTIILPFEPDNFTTLKDFFQRSNTNLLIAEKNYQKKLVNIAVKNAAFYHKNQILKDQVSFFTLQKLKEFLGLTKVPENIECVDISHIQGTATVASVVHFKKGRPDKSMYRHYNLESEMKPDDFNSIYQTIRRRLKRARREGYVPDFILIDGGKGQLGAALRAAKDEDFQSIDFASIAKSRSKPGRGNDAIISRTEERIFIPGKNDPLVPQSGSSVFRLLISLRDEAHRFAVEHHRKRRQAVRYRPEFENIPGIGPVLRKRLMLAFGSVEKAATSTKEDLLKIKGISPRLANLITAYFTK